MKLKKHISKLLFYSILLNNIYFNSNAVSNHDLSRHETLEGEFIDLGDTKSEDITEIEIFGNTVQDENNLENIQSVGELYVDNNGQPILDELGREQYKIEIVSKAANLLDIDNSSLKKIVWNYPLNATLDEQKVTFENAENQRDNAAGFNELMRVKPGQTVYVYAKVNYKNVNPLGGRISIGMTSPSSWYGGPNVYKIPPDSNGEFILKSKFTNNYNDEQDIYLSGTNNGIVGGTVIFSDITISTLDTNSFIPYIQNKTTILLPCQLMKVGDVKDRLYWDSEKGRYVIEKAFSETPYKLTQAINPTWIMDSYVIFRFNSFSGMKQSPKVLCNRLSNSSKIIPSIHGNGAYTRIHMPLSINTKDILQSWIDEKDVYIWYELGTPQLIETNITKKIKLTTYPEKTYIFTASNNGVQSSLKITVDRIEEVSQEAVENVLSNPTSNNIALARMFVNLLPESLYKDQLQSQLNEIFSEDMVLNKQTATANLDVYIQSENILMMSLNTNTVTFEDYSGVEELEIKNAINISINSSLPYQLNAYIVGDITNKNKDKTLDLDVFNIKDSNETTYQKFDSVNNKIILKDNCNKGNNISHNIDLKLSGNKAHDADVYKTTIKFEVEQK